MVRRTPATPTLQDVYLRVVNSSLFILNSQLVFETHGVTGESMIGTCVAGSLRRRRAR